MTHICVSKFTIIGSDNGWSPGRRQAIIWTNAGILLIWSLGTNFSEIWIEIQMSPFKKMHLKMPSGKWRPSCLGLNVLTYCPQWYVLISVKWVNIGSGNKWLVAFSSPNYYLNQCSLVINWTIKNKLNKILIRIWKSSCIWKCLLQNVHYFAEGIMSLKMYNFLPLVWYMLYLFLYCVPRIIFIVNPLRAKFLRENINIYLHFMSSLHTDKTPIVEIPPRARQRPAYSM